MPKQQRHALGICALLVLLCTTSCYSTTYVKKGASRGMKEKGSISYFFWGLVGEPTVRVYEICPQGAAKVNSRQSIVDSILNIITIGIYSPRTYEVTCEAASAKESV